MGWFWANSTPSTAAKPENHPTNGSPPPSCPMNKPTPASGATAMIETPSACPYPSASTSSSSASTTTTTTSSSTTSTTTSPNDDQTLNPLNFMFSNLPQTRAPGQTTTLPTSREASTIPKADGAVWEYPSPQQMYNAMRRKGYDNNNNDDNDTPEDAVESMVAIHNWLNEGAWAEITSWESRFRGGVLGHLGLRNPAPTADDSNWEPRLLRFQGRRADVTPKARLYGFLGRIMPESFGGPAPFDRHDWYVLRKSPGELQPREVRYVIDYYAGPPEPTGEPVFYLDVRPALDRPGLVMERIVAWTGETWEKAAGLDVRRAEREEARRKAATGA